MFYGRDPLPLTGSGKMLANGASVLDHTLEEIQRGTPDDPWRSIVPTGFPGFQHSNSVVIQKCLILIEAALKQRSVAAQLLEGLDADLSLLAELAGLTELETDVLALTGNGWSQRDIANWLDVGQATVSRRLRSGRGKLADQLPDAVALRLDMVNQ